MTTRIVTGAALLVVLAFAVIMGSWVFAVLFMAALCMCVYEVYRALKGAGNHLVEWPVWMCVVVSVPLFVLTKSAVLPLFLSVCACFLVCTNIVFRGEPKLDDLTASCLPLVSILMPGLCMLAFLQSDSRRIQSMMIILSFGIPLMGDTLAYFIGSRYGVKKLCPAVSPNKTVEGAVAGLFGSILFSVLCAVCFGFSGEIPALWKFLLLGFVGGFAGEIGDLFASLVKRHCKVKDFGTLFPGHGGMMDRLDSVFFSTVVVYIFYSIVNV